MTRHIAFLRGVSAMNCKMPALKAAFESAGFKNVRTVLGSGNVVFDAPHADACKLEAAAEAAMARELGRSFYTIVRRREELEALIAADPYTELSIPAEAKRVVSFFRQPPVPRVALPLAQDLASVFLVRGREAYTAYVPQANDPVFMGLIERVFGKDVTTRTLATVQKCAKA